ncbi:hypothetical protein JL720_6176 [Aureococcus anophagefferens]|nr:hypothetical protein JL720_6176 [Aureococcus anophagefferens]
MGGARRKSVLPGKNDMQMAGDKMGEIAEIRSRALQKTAAVYEKRRMTMGKVMAQEAKELRKIEIQLADFERQHDALAAGRARAPAAAAARGARHGRGEAPRGRRAVPRGVPELPPPAHGLPEPPGHRRPGTANRIIATKTPEKTKRPNTSGGRVLGGKGGFDRIA